MTCKIEAGLDYQDQESGALLCDKAKSFKMGDLQIEITTGGMDQPTHVAVIGKKLNYLIYGKVKPWFIIGGSVFNLYGNGASISLLSPEHPYHLKITNLPKGL